MNDVPQISNVIEKEVSDLSMNFDKLREEALADVQKYSGAEWTDYNLHDPGITILEALCFALTDLSYRTGFSITDILSDASGAIDYDDQSFHLPVQILNTHPVLINDYRKLVIDQVEEVQNVWLSGPNELFGATTIRGLMSVSLQLTVTAWQSINENENEDQKQIKKEAIITKVKQVLLNNRMIGTDFYHFKIIEPRKIKIIAKVAIDSKVPPEELLAEIYWAINNFLNPSIVYSSPDDLILNNEQVADIFNGPTLKKGIIKDHTLKELPTQIEPADLIRLVAKVLGVLNVISLVITDGIITTSEEPLLLKEGEFGSINPLIDFSTIELLRDEVDVIVRKQYFSSFYKKLVKENESKFNGYNAIFSDKRTGQYRRLARYYSIQHHFPSVYGIGREGISNSESDERKAAVKQLKGYLLVFEQIMGNYLSQLASVNKLFSYKIDSEHRHTYFAQPILDVPGINELISFMTLLPKDKRGNFQKQQFEKAVAQYQQTLTKLVESDNDYVERKNAFLDHMLSRFNYSLNNYPVELSEHYYQLKDLQRNNDTLHWKSEFLQNIVYYSSNRARGTNYHTIDKNQPFDYLHLLYKLLFIRNKPFNSTLHFLSNENEGVININRQPMEESVVDSKLVLLDEVITVKNQSQSGRLKENFEKQSELLVFEFQNEQIFKDACNVDNFKVSPDVFTNKDFIILFHQANEKEWRVVGKTKNIADAKNKIQNTVQYFINLSIQSEGIHMIENILLRPNVNSLCYGFQFLYENNIDPLLISKNWLSMPDRNNLLRYIQELIEMNELSIKEKLSILNKYFHITALNNISLDNAYDDVISTIYLKIASVFEKFSNNDYEFVNKRIKLLVKYPNGLEVDESIFDSQICLVLPGWTARFQDLNFRKFLHKIALEYTPAHLQLSIHYLSIDEMQQFESLYFSWLSFLQVNNDYEFKNMSSSLITFLNLS